MKRKLILGYFVALSGCSVLADNINLLTEKDTAAFTHTFTGADLHDSNGPGFQNGWTGGGTGMTLTTTGSTLNIATVGSTSGATLSGTDSTDAGAESWNTGVTGTADPFTIELSLRD